MHPVNSNDFGANGITMTYSVDGSTTTTGQIVRQISQNKYVVSPGPIGEAYVNTYVTVTLASTLAQVAKLPAFYGTILVNPVPVGTAPQENAYKLASRKVLTVQGNSYNWRKTTAVNPGEANIVGNWYTGPDAAGFKDKVNV